jgi:hypothetical protein
VAAFDIRTVTAASSVIKGIKCSYCRHKYYKDEISRSHSGERRSHWPRGLKPWVCGRSPADIVGSNPYGGVDVCLF